ncbi:PpiC-type peptidyl-prolyl cis-trans isomerase [Moraxella macacae 0408225]|uniref:peptidylprolyl isomerase n=2 Tax=Moraxella macacae TaxID=765840 RepID=L2F8K3_9GAMM|nr:PpiC-type peptidyl-prolyl cis-trans isomerase [Moraxella macacae 0408225]
MRVHSFHPKQNNQAHFNDLKPTKEQSKPANLIATSRETLPKITVNGIAIDPKQIAQETQYHPANSKDDALYLSARALVMRELLRQAVLAESSLGLAAWERDEEQAIGDLLSKNVLPKNPTDTNITQYYQQNRAQFTTPPIITARHILLASPPEEGDERLQLKKQASEIIEKIQNSHNPDADFLFYAQQLSACPSKNDGGNLGVIKKGTTIPEFETAVFALPKGLGVNPIETRYGIHIVDVIDKKEGLALNFAQAKPMIVNHLTQQSFHHSLVDYLFKLSQNAKIEGIELNMHEENVYRG